MTLTLWLVLCVMGSHSVIVIMPGATDTRIHSHSNLAHLLSSDVYLIAQFIFSVIDFLQNLLSDPRIVKERTQSPGAARVVHRTPALKPETAQPWVCPVAARTLVKDVRAMTLGSLSSYKWRRWVMSALTQLQNTGETEPIITFR